LFACRLNVLWYEFGAWANRWLILQSKSAWFVSLGLSSDSQASAGQYRLQLWSFAARDFFEGGWACGVVAKKVAKVFKDAMSLRLTLASKWTGPGLDFSISERDALQLRDQIIVNGFPSPFLDRLKELGVDGNDRDILLQRLIVELANLPSFRQISFPDLLVDPKLRAAVLGLASSLDQFSRSR